VNQVQVGSRSAEPLQNGRRPVSTGSESGTPGPRHIAWCHRSAAVSGGRTRATCALGSCWRPDLRVVWV
jgi:hypothetical protein